MVEREHVSALMDGEAGEEDLAAKLRRVAADEDLAGTWYVYHTIGDVLRGEAALTAQFAGRVSAKLGGEPTVLAPVARHSFATRRMLRAAMPIAASVAGVAAVAWLALSGLTAQSPDAAKVASLQAVSTAKAPPMQAAVPEMDEYLLAHQAYSPATAMQGVGSYIRSVSARER